jgi:hypothetical protein
MQTHGLVDKLSDLMLKLESLFPREQWERTSVGAEAPAIDSDVPMFRMKGSELRIIIVPGVVPGTRTVIGYHVLFRAGDDSMNMHAECPCDERSLRAMIKTAVALSGTAPISHRKFVENFVRWYGELHADGRTRWLSEQAERDTETDRTYVGVQVESPPPSLYQTPSATVDSSTFYPSTLATYDIDQRQFLLLDTRAGAASPVSPGASESAAQQAPSEASAGSASAKAQSLDGQSSEQSTGKRARVAKDETVDCSVCMVAPADTLAVPCGHSVVCAACSRTLAAQTGSANRTHCVVCRALITHVAYPDNSVVAIN